MEKNVEKLKEFIVTCLEEKKAGEIRVINIKQQTTLADYIIFANGRSTKNVGAIAEYLALELKKQAKINVNIEGLAKSNWVLIDAGNILVNILHPEAREYFKLEEIWEKDMKKISK